MLNGDLRAFLDANLACDSGIIVDEDYALLTREDFFGRFAEALDFNKQKLRVDVYRAEINDCDDFSLYAFTLARLAHKLQFKGKKSLGVGMLAYRMDSGGGHAIIFAVIKEESVFRLLFMEPQTCQQAQLSSTEKLNAIYYYI